MGADVAGMLVKIEAEGTHFAQVAEMPCVPAPELPTGEVSRPELAAALRAQRDACARMNDPRPALLALLSSVTRRVEESPQLLFLVSRTRL